MTTSSCAGSKPVATACYRRNIKQDIDLRLKNGPSSSITLLYTFLAHLKATYLGKHATWHFPATGGEKQHLSVMPARTYASSNGLLLGCYWGSYWRINHE